MISYIYKKHINISLIFSFIILSVLSVSVIYVHNKIYFTGDETFHIERLIELLRSNSFMPQYAFNSFSKSGSSVILMYPYVSLYLMAFIFHIVNSFKITLYLVFSIGTFITLIISYYSSLKFSKDKLVSYLFSVIYALSYEFTNLYFTSSVIGIYFSSIFLPLVIFGCIYYLKYNKWIMLSVGMSLILCNSLITCAFLIVLLIIFLLFNINLMSDVHKLISLIKATLLTLITTAFVWIPIIKMSVTNKIRTPTCKNIAPILVLHVIYHTLFPSLTMPAQSLTVSSFFGIIFGVLTYKKMPVMIKRLYQFAIFILLFFSKIIPWRIFDDNFILFKLIRSIQTNYRLLIVPQLLFSFILSYGIVYYLNKHIHDLKIILIVCLFICLIIILQISGQVFSFNAHGVGKTINNSSLSNIYYANYDSGYHHDYYPKALSGRSLNMLDNDMSMYHQHIIHFYKYNNGLMYFNTRYNMKRLTIPFIYYNKVNYTDYLDNRLIKLHSNKQQLMVINNVRAGNHQLHITVSLDMMTIVSRIVTIISVPIYGILIIKRYRYYYR